MGDDGMSDRIKSATTFGGISIAVIIVWLVVVGQYKARVDEACRGVAEIRPRILAAEIANVETRGEVKIVQAETRQMFAEVMRRLGPIDTKLDTLLTEKRQQP